jgi:CTP:molybdopterin cytidylyltransferase MocA
MIEDHTARTVAWHYRGSTECGLHAVALLGQICDPFEVLHEINEEVRGLPPDTPAANMLQELAEYVIHVGERGAVAGWSELWDWEADRVLQGFVS